MNEILGKKVQAQVCPGKGDKKRFTSLSLACGPTAGLAQGKHPACPTPTPGVTPESFPWATACALYTLLPRAAQSRHVL